MRNGRIGMPDANEKGFIYILFLYNHLPIIKMPGFDCLHILIDFILKVVVVFSV